MRFFSIKEIREKTVFSLRRIQKFSSIIFLNNKFDNTTCLQVQNFLCTLQQKLNPNLIIF